jgi:hypothetical protein
MEVIVSNLYKLSGRLIGLTLIAMLMVMTWVPGVAAQVSFEEDVFPILELNLARDLDAARAQTALKVRAAGNQVLGDARRAGQLTGLGRSACLGIQSEAHRVSTRTRKPRGVTGAYGLL